MRRPNRPAVLNQVMKPVWQARPDGTMRAECGSLCLTVHPPASGGYARFVVRRCMGPDERPDALVVSGTRDGLEAAIHGAEEVAQRLMAAVRSDLSVRL